MQVPCTDLCARHLFAAAVVVVCRQGEWDLYAKLQWTGGFDYPPNAFCGGIPCSQTNKGSSCASMDFGHLACWGTPFAQNCGDSIICSIYNSMCSTALAFLAYAALYVCTTIYFTVKHVKTRQTPKQGGTRAMIVPGFKLAMSVAVALNAMAGKSIWADSVNAHGVVTGMSLIASPFKILVSVFVFSMTTGFRGAARHPSQIS